MLVEFNLTFQEILSQSMTFIDGPYGLPILKQKVSITTSVNTSRSKGARSESHLPWGFLHLVLLKRLIHQYECPPNTLTNFFECFMDYDNLEQKSQRNGGIMYYGSLDWVQNEFIK